MSSVQRWEQEEGLPVHRLLHSKAGSVYAVRSELDRWFTAREAMLEPAPPVTPPTIALPVPPDQPAAEVAVPHRRPDDDASISSSLARAGRSVIDIARDSWRGPAALLLSRVSSHEIAVNVVRPWDWRGLTRTLGRVVLPAVALTAAIAAVLAWWAWPATTVRPLERVQVDVAPADELNAGGFASSIGTAGGSRTALRWTPDGRSLVFVGRRSGTQRLYVRNLARAEASPLAGTDGAQVPALSPDGRWIVFWADGEIRRVPLAGGPVQTIVRDVTIAPAGMTVSAAGRVIFSAGTPPGEPSTESLWTAAPDGVVTRQTTQAAGELAHLAPQLVDGDRALLFTVKRTGRGRDQVVGQVLASGARTVLVNDAADGRYDASSGQLLFMRRWQLMAAPLDVRAMRLTGQPIAVAAPVAQALMSSNGIDVTAAGQFDASAGTLAYIRGGPVDFGKIPLVVLDRTGRATTLPFEPRAYDTLALSPDGRLLAVPVESLLERQLFIADLGRGTLTKLPSAGEPIFPRWSPDGRWIAFGTLRDGAWELARQRTDGSGLPERLVSGIWWVSSWSPDGRYIAAVREGDIWVIDLNGARPSPRQLTQSKDWDGSPVFSPDGRWLAFASTMNGHREVFLRPFPGEGPTVQASVGGGTNPLWTRGGHELVFIQPVAGAPRGYRFMAVGVAGARVGTAHPLFTLPADMGPCLPNPCYAVSRDGEHFYAGGSPIESQAPAPVTHVDVVLNWPELLKPATQTP